jgi:hypothetical protein
MTSSDSSQIVASHLSNLANGTDDKVPPPAKISVRDAKRLKETLLQKYEHIGQALVDKKLAGQDLAIVTFMPALGATPNKVGHYGFMKVRGCFKDIEDANAQAINIIRHSDQVTPNLIVRVGHPFPIVMNSGLPEEYVKSVDLDKPVTEAHTEAAKHLMEENKKVKDDLDNRAKQLQASCDAELTDTDKYISLRTTCAAQVDLYLNLVNNIAAVKARIISCHAKRIEADSADAELDVVFRDSILHDMKTAGIVRGEDDRLNEMVDKREQLLFDYPSLVPDLLRSARQGGAACGDLHGSFM